MKKIIVDFVRRGFIACGFGPLVLAVIYIILNKTANVVMLDINEVSMGIFTISALAFVAGGMNVLYQIERLPLMWAILIHGTVLYIGYLLTYLVNGWLEWGTIAVLVFTAIFVVGYIVIWVIIYSTTKRNTKKVNEMLINKNC